MPPVPAPPTGFDDERQGTFVHIARVVTTSFGERRGTFRTANVTAGYRASAVDLGHLQHIIGEAIARFDMEQVRERWNDDLSAWMRRLLFTWVQRCKFIHFKLAEKGIRIQLETQDDRGYYEYVFDVFPGRGD